MKTMKTMKTREENAAYIEGYLTCLEQMARFTNGHPDVSVEDLLFAFRMSARTVFTDGLDRYPGDLQNYPLLLALLWEGRGI